jgi:hypothetical protein
MGLESATYISGLDSSNPDGADSISQGDNHIRLIKSVLKATLPNADEAINGIHTSASAPSPTTAGLCWFDTTDDVLKVRNKANSAWVILSASPVTSYKVLGSPTVGWTLPTSEGSSGDLLSTNGSGGFTFTAATAAIPSGVIVMWSGAVSAIPSGWVICDGTSSTPNLTGKFIIHADSDSGGTYDVGDNAALANTGATAITTSQMPAHTHSYLQRGFTKADPGSGSQDFSDEGGSLSTGSAGGGGTHTHTGSLPPYYALAYIMKT